MDLTLIKRYPVCLITRREAREWYDRETSLNITMRHYLVAYA